MRTQFSFLVDPDHGWLIVTLLDLEEVGLSEFDFTPFSYTNGGRIGLEQDQDAVTFLEAYKSRFGGDPEIFDEVGSCRSWAPFGLRCRQLGGAHG